MSLAESLAEGEAPSQAPRLEEESVLLSTAAPALANAARAPQVSDAASPQQPQPVAATTDNMRERFCMLIAVSLCSATNAFLCMTFSVIDEISAQALSVSTVKVADLYSFYLTITFVGLTPGAFMTDRYEGFSLVWSALLNVASAMVRVFGALHGSYNLIVVSEILCGVGAWTIFTLPSKVSHRLFPVQQQALATSIMLQANYVGWLFGILIPPFVAAGPTSFGRICAWQAVVTLIASTAASLLLDLSKSGAQRIIQVEESRAPHGTSGFMDIVQLMIKYPRLAVQILSHGLLGGISFAAPSATFFILNNFGFSSAAATAVNSAFVASGIVSGVVLGRVCTEKQSFEKVLATCYATCFASLMACAVLAAMGTLSGDSVLGPALMLLLSVLSGSSSLGFIGIGIEATSLYPARPSFVSWSIELVVLASAAVLSDVAAGRSGFVVLAVAAALCTLAHFSSFRVDSAGMPLLGSDRHPTDS